MIQILQRLSLMLSSNLYENSLLEVITRGCSEAAKAVIVVQQFRAGVGLSHPYHYMSDQPL